MNIDFSKLDTSKFLYNPKSEDFIDELERDIPELISWNEPINKELFCKYLTVMYDTASPINKAYQSTNFMIRKYQCCTLVGLEVQRESPLEEYLIGKNDFLNDITIKFIMQFGSPEIMSLIAYMAILDFLTKRALDGTFEKHEPKQIQDITELINSKSSKLLLTGGEQESSALLRQLYREVDTQKALKTPEVIHKHIMDGTISDILDSPYGDYDFGEMKFIADE